MGDVGEQQQLHRLTAPLAPSGCLRGWPLARAPTQPLPAGGRRLAGTRAGRQGPRVGSDRQKWQPADRTGRALTVQWLTILPADRPRGPPDRARTPTYSPKSGICGHPNRHDRQIVQACVGTAGRLHLAKRDDARRWQAAVGPEGVHAGLRQARPGRQRPSLPQAGAPRPAGCRDQRRGTCTRTRAWSWPVRGAADVCSRRRSQSCGAESSILA